MRQQHEGWPAGRPFGGCDHPRANRIADLRACLQNGPLPAYVISEVEVLDATQGQRYRELAAASIAQHGGRYIVRGAERKVPESEWPAAQRVVVVEFPSTKRLQGWYGSSDYAEALAVRQTALRRRLLFVEGVSD
jgi:uncharacterized protein (DUF1330 family)